MLREAGFDGINICLREESREVIKTWFPGSGVEDFVRSASIQAHKEPFAAAGTAGVDARTEELIAIGAALAVHCQPCLTYHVASARGLGLAEADLRTAMEIGQRVEQGAQAAMGRFAAGIAVGPSAAAPSCCGGAARRGKTCCS
jgi:AhpD family alkylhydroperoxidase